MMILAVSWLCRRGTDLLLLSSLVCLSSLAPRHVSCQLDNIRESAGKLFNSLKDTVKENLGPAVKKVTETASDALDVAKRKVSEALGPDLNDGNRRREPREGESCPAEGCSYDNEDGHGGYSPPRSEMIQFEDDEPGLLRTILGSASTGLANVGRTLYDTLSDMSSRFAETVRKIMSEELYDLLAGAAKKVGAAMFSPGATLYYLGETTATIGLALLCLLFSYIFLNFFSIHFILFFLCGMFLLHQLLGPILLFEWIFYVIQHFVVFAKFLARHYYATAALIVLTFGYSLVKVIIRWTVEPSERQQREQLLACLLDQTVRIRELEAMLVNRIQSLEDNQREMIRTLQELRDAVRPPS